MAVRNEEPRRFNLSNPDNWQPGAVQGCSRRCAAAEQYTTEIEASSAELRVKLRILNTFDVRIKGREALRVAHDDTAVADEEVGSASLQHSLQISDAVAHHDHALIGVLPAQLADGGGLALVVGDCLFRVKPSELAGQARCVVNVPVHAVGHHVARWNIQELR
jgi:hypothetical protein